MYNDNSKLSDEKKYDPWEKKQNIAEVKVAMHCSRYWMLWEWECENMSFPFWRLYHSKTGGSFVTYNETEFELSNDKIILIPPYTSFSTHIKKQPLLRDESIIGKIIIRASEVDYYKNKGMCDQLFVHFNLGFPYDKMKPGIYEIQVNDVWIEEINKVKINRLESPDTISIHSNMKIKGLILYALQGIPEKLWNFPVVDKRIMKVVTYIEKNINKNLSNERLSEIANLATNSFSRLFKANMKCTAQNYIQFRRVENAILTFHHSNKEIEEIALECGFYDRHHFSKIFKKQTGISPAKYRLKINT